MEQEREPKKLTIFILLSSDENTTSTKIIVRSFANALTTLEIGQEMEEWTEHENHCEMILMRRYRKDADGSVLVIPLRRP